MIAVDKLEDETPICASERFRIEMTVGCHDADHIPKVPRAGEGVSENGTDVQIMHNGIRVVASGYHGKWMMEIIARLRGHHEPQEEAAFNETLRHVPADATMLEIGGYWSYYSLWFLHGFAMRRAFVIEPDPNYLAVARSNAALNHASILFTQAFVGKQSLDAAPFATETAGTMALPMIAVPDYLREHKIDRLDILHCDAQGVELDVLQSCEELLQNQAIRFLILSTHVHHISGDPLTHQRCLHLLRGVAYCGQEPIDWHEVKLSYNRYSTSLFRNPLYDLAAGVKLNPTAVR